MEKAFQERYRLIFPCLYFCTNTMYSSQTIGLYKSSLRIFDKMISMCNWSLGCNNQHVTQVIGIWILIFGMTIKFIFAGILHLNSTRQVDWVWIWVFLNFKRRVGASSFRDIDIHIKSAAFILKFDFASFYIRNPWTIF
jgi:hypothetical protein